MIAHGVTQVNLLADSCPHLIRLDLEETEVTGAGLRPFACSAGVRNFRTINLYGCSSVGATATFNLRLHESEISYPCASWLGNADVNAFVT